MCSHPPLVLDVGQCNPDHRAIHRLVTSAGAEILRAHTADEAIDILSTATISLVLVNRIFDLDGTDGISFIRRLKQEHGELSVMLISNYGWAQEEARNAGALEGFGKAALEESQTSERIRAALALTAHSTA